uniref:AlNc14C171G7996 protein n=1 Tax=Albugo laibachii Nc14 TaxID=890382 RepID=F0WNH1_9STRA|nr:AlNc14C171G7996 [Albugo laibachii Nc14]|eukprot:CCA22862.1 AlNc14C171G7996 [Albugo laibachii Nc14]
MMGELGFDSEEGALETAAASKERLNRDVLDACNIPGATITTSEAGFMTTRIMREYIAAFALAVPLPIKRPLILVLDGASSHMDASIDAAATTYGVRLVQLPPNASHLYQPLDVAVFRAAKTILQEKMYSFMITTGKTAMTKKEAVQLASTAWRMRIEEKPETSQLASRRPGFGRFLSPWY